MSGLKSIVNTSSYEEVYKTAYSHGLEAIYTLENVDLKTVRRISSPQPAAPSKPQKPARQVVNTSHTNEQLEFNFGEEYRNSIDSFILDEPIQVLGLSRHAERCLIEHGKSKLRDLTAVNLRDFVFFKGMGQGHIDEVQNRLKNYLEGHVIHNCPYVDFNSLIRVLVSAHNAKKVHIFLEPFELSELITLSPAESLEVRRLTLEKRQEWSQEIKVEFVSPQKQHYVLTAMQKIIDVFIKPWMRCRMGFASYQELLERIQRIADPPASAVRTLNFIEEVYLEKHPLENYLLYEKDLYFVDYHIQECYQTVIKRALTYFYKRGVAYTLSELCRLLTKEFAVEWRGFAEGFIEKCLCSSSLFTVRSNQTRQLMVSLSAFANPSFRKTHASHTPQGLA